VTQRHPGYRTAFATPWFTIEETIEPHPFYRMTGPDGVICLPLTRAGDVVLVRQYRPAIELDTIEVPAGGIEPGETPEEAALREVREETGYQCGRIHRVGRGRLLPNRCAWQEFFAVGLDADPVAYDAEPGTETLIVARPDFRRMIAAGEIEQSAVICLLGMATITLGVDLLTASIVSIGHAFDIAMARAL
jgi:ADP-ribose pyrophosphatase